MPLSAFNRITDAILSPQKVGLVGGPINDETFVKFILLSGDGRFLYIIHETSFIKSPFLRIVDSRTYTILRSSGSEDDDSPLFNRHHNAQLSEMEVLSETGDLVRITACGPRGLIFACRHVQSTSTIRIFYKPNPMDDDRADVFLRSINLIAPDNRPFSTLPGFFCTPYDDFRAVHVLGEDAIVRSVPVADSAPENENQSRRSGDRFSDIDQKLLSAQVDWNDCRNGKFYAVFERAFAVCFLCENTPTIVLNVDAQSIGAEISAFCIDKNAGLAVIANAAAGRLYNVDLTDGRTTEMGENVLDGYGKIVSIALAESGRYVILYWCEDARCSLRPVEGHAHLMEAFDGPPTLKRLCDAACGFEMEL